jgi:hypothetical protein
MTQEPVEPLTEYEQKLIGTPIAELRKTGLVPTAIAALDKKFAAIRAENAIYAQENP